MQQCDTCAPGFGKDGRVCQALSVPPRFTFGGNLREVYLPLGAPNQTVVANFVVVPETSSVGPIVLALEGATVPLAIDASGALRLMAPFVAPGTVTVVARDQRSQCIQLGSGNTILVTPGGCTSSLVVVLQVAAFLNCPTNITAYTSDSTVASVSWIEPQLPFFLGNISVSRQLGQTNQSNSPYSYPVGQHFVSYTAVLPTAGLMSCNFSVVVRPGIGLLVSEVADVVMPNQRLQYLVVESAVSGSAAQLPVVYNLPNTRLFNMGIRHQRGLVFTATTQVRVAF